MNENCFSIVRVNFFPKSDGSDSYMKTKIHWTFIWDGIYDRKLVFCEGGPSADVGGHQHFTPTLYHQRSPDTNNHHGRSPNESAWFLYSIAQLYSIPYSTEPDIHSPASLLPTNIRPFTFILKYWRLLALKCSRSSFFLSAEMPSSNFSSFQRDEA